MPPIVKKNITRKLAGERPKKTVRRIIPVKKPEIPIGARNPYAVYRAVAGNNPFPGMHPVDIRKMLGEYIGHSLKYDQLFDPRWGSCLFCKKTIDAVKPVSVRIEANYESIDASGGGSAGAAPQPFADCAQKLAQSAWTARAGSDPESPGSLKFDWFSQPLTGGYPDQISPAFDEIAQGPIPDCYYLAALSSLAWFYALYPAANPSGKIISDPQNQIPFWTPDDIPVSVGGLHSTPPGDGYHLIHTDYTLPLDTDDQPAGALTEPGMSGWVPFYEKAFARYLETINRIIPPSPDERYPDICRIPCGYSGETLRALIQVNSAKLGYHDTGVKKLPGGTEVQTAWNKTTVWDTIKARICETGIFTAGKSLKTKYPAVAETCCTGDPTIPPVINNPPPCAAAAGSGVAYADDLLVASHSYSILGVHKGKDTRDYVILRNPYGENWGFLSGQHPYGLLGVSSADVTLSFASIKVRTKPYLRELFISRTLRDGTVVKTPKGGVFGLHIDDFIKYFRIISWVVR